MPEEGGRVTSEARMTRYTCASVTSPANLLIADVDPNRDVEGGGVGRQAPIKQDARKLHHQWRLSMRS